MTTVTMQMQSTSSFVILVIPHPFPLPPSSFSSILPPPARGTWPSTKSCWRPRRPTANVRCGSIAGRSRRCRWDTSRLMPTAGSTSPAVALPVVRRMSGGGAILHDVELTYSFAVPSHHPLAINRLGFYQAVHTALIEALAQWGIEAAMFAQAEGGRRKAEGGRVAHTTATDINIISHPRRPPAAFPLPPVRQPFLCFQRRSPGDVLVGETKVAGSAQRRSRGAVLQHGSVLLARSPAAPELIGLKELVDKIVGPEQLAEAWLGRLAVTLPITWQAGGLSDDQRRRAATWAAKIRVPRLDGEPTTGLKPLTATTKLVTIKRRGVNLAEPSTPFGGYVADGAVEPASLFVRGSGPWK